MGSDLSEECKAEDPPAEPLAELTASSGNPVLGGVSLMGAVIA